jgi:hypothetical protein
MRLLYDEQSIRELPMTYTDDNGDTVDGFDCYYLRVRLYKDTISEQDISCPLYLLHLLHEDYVGKPGNEGGRARVSEKKRAFLRGPDSKRIRDAIAVIDAHDGHRASGSS